MPRYMVELNPDGPAVVAPTASRSATTIGPRRRQMAASGPQYIYECTYCGKRFRRNDGLRG